MSGSETGVNVMTTTTTATGREQQQPFSAVTLQKAPLPSQSPSMNMRLSFGPDGTAIYKPITVSSLSGGDASAASQPPSVTIGSDLMRPKKRGRPRKYGPDGTMNLGLTPSLSPSNPSMNVNTGGFSITGAVSPPSPNSMKKPRGRPPGSGKKHQIEALGSAGSGFTPHVITVKAGEDVSSKIMSFSQNGPRAVCVLAANGAISNVTLRQAATSGGTVTYEGRFEILSLSGSFLLSDNGGQRSRTGGLSVSLSGPDGRVLGGSVAGLLTAAAPIQVVVGSFIPDGHKESKSNHQPEPLSIPPKLGAHTAGPSSPPSRGTLSESSGGGPASPLNQRPASPLNQSTSACNNSHPPGISMPWK